MAENVLYAVWPERGNLVRFTGTRAELFTPRGEREWTELPHLNEIRTGFGNSIWYDFIDEGEARVWMDRLRNGS